MRIIGGTARGRTLGGPKHSGLRPTSDRVRQVLFDLLGQRFDGGAVLDLYCGTGALALEALSRGCSQGLLVDSDRAALDLSRSNAEALGFAAGPSPRSGLGPGVGPGGCVELWQLQLPQGLSSLPTTPRLLVFADPPYAGATPSLNAVLRWVGQSGILRPDGLLAIEASTHGDFDPAGATPPTLQHRLCRRVGDTLLHLFQRGS